LKRIIDFLFYSGLDKETYQKYKDYVLKQDVKYLSYYLLIAGILYVFLGITSVKSYGFAHRNTNIYFVTAASFFFVLLCQKLTIRLKGETSKINRVYIYMFMMILYIESIELTVIHKDLPAVTYIGVLLILPLLFAQNPLPMSIFQGCFVAIFCIFVSKYKYPNIAAIDVWNGISFFIVSVMVVILIIPIRFKQMIQPEIIRELSERDMLTKVKNRNSYEMYCESIDHVNEGMYCTYVDANGLHEMNNKYGHEAGDNMLKCVASVMIDTFGNENVYRIGGDEFVAFSLEFDDGQIKSCISEIKKKLEQMGYNLSIGCSVSERSCEGIYQLIKEAEARMYDDKRDYYSNADNNRRCRRF